MGRRFLYKFHNKIMVFVVSIAGALLGIFFTYQVIYNNIKMQNAIESSLNESSLRFDKFINTKVNLLDKIARCLIDDSTLEKALIMKNNEEIKKRIDFFIPLLDNVTLEIIDEKGSYYSASNVSPSHKIEDSLRKKIEKTTGSNGTIFFSDTSDGIDIKYALRGNIFSKPAGNGIIILGFSIDSNSDLLFLIKEFIDADIMILRNGRIIATSILQKAEVSDKKYPPLKIDFSAKNSNTIMEHNGKIYSVKYQKLINDRGVSDTVLGFAIDRKEIIGNTYATLILTLTVALIVFIIMIIFSSYISARLTNPLTQLINASASNAHGGFVKVNYLGNNEIGALTKNFNIMINELNEVKTNLENIVEKRTNELNDSNKELSRTYKQLEYVYKKSQFELRIAKKVHDALLHEQRSDSEVIEISSMYMPIETLNIPQYDIYKISESKVGILLFDISGPDLPTTLLSTLTRLSFRNTARRKIPMPEIFAIVEEELSSILSETITGISIFYGVINTEKKIFEYTNACCKDIYIQRKNGQLLHLEPNSPLVGSSSNNIFSSAIIPLEQHDRIIYLANGVENLYNGFTSGYSPFERFETIIRKNICNTIRDFVVDIANDIASYKSDHIPRNPVIFSSDIIFIRREAIEELDVAGLKGKIEKELPLCKNYETEYINKVFLKALNAFENGDYDKAIKELNRINGRNERNIDLFNMFDIFAHSYFKIESYEQAMIYWEEAVKYGSESASVKNNIEITKRIIDEKMLRRLQG